MYKKKLATICILATLFSCQDASNDYKTDSTPQSNIFNKLAGTWAYTDSTGEFRESWIKINDTLYHSSSVQIKNSDTLFSEEVDVFIGANYKKFVPTVKSQNDGKEVVFDIITINENSFIAQNLQHDFPQKICYELKKDSIIAYIEGNNNSGQLRREYFRMKKK